MKPRRASAIALASLLSAFGATALGAPAAHADVSLTCSTTYGNYTFLYDSRTPTDKQVKPGVVVRTDFEYTNDEYEMFTVNADGSKDWIFIAAHPTDYPIVAVWQNGTSCSGSASSRNAWAVAADGKVFSDGTFSGPIAGNYGDMFGTGLAKPIVGMSPTTTGLGYWLVASDGGIFAFGDAVFYGSTGAMTLNKPIAGMSVTPTGKGYWLVASDGGIFAFGDAKFYGSMGGAQLNRPISAMVTSPTGAGYWMVADDGGIFAFGDAPFKGSTGSQHLSAPIAGMVPNGGGYTLIGQDGQLYPFA